MSAIQKVVLAGASNTGSIGAAILSALLKANFEVTVLTRLESAHSFPAAVNTIKVDYNDKEALARVMQGQDAFVAAFGYTAIKIQEPLIDAAIAAGVKRLIPSEFGGDPENLAVRQLPVFADKVKIEKYIKEKVRGTSTTYTLVCNNEFIDWDLDFKFNIDIQAKKIEIFDGGDNVYTATPLDFVANGVVRVLQLPDKTANRVIRLHGKSMTQNQLLAILQRLTGKEGWTVTHASTTEREKQARQAYENDPDNFYAWIVPFLECAVWGRSFGGDFSQNNDNELLGLQEMSSAEFEDMIRGRL